MHWLSVASLERSVQLAAPSNRRLAQAARVNLVAYCESTHTRTNQSSSHKRKLTPKPKICITKCVVSL